MIPELKAYTKKIDQILGVILQVTDDEIFIFSFDVVL